MTVSKELEAEIARLFFAEGWKVGTIARQLGVHHDVVRRVLGRVLSPRLADICAATARRAGCAWSSL